MLPAASTGMRKFQRDSENTQKGQYQPAGNVNIHQHSNHPFASAASNSAERCWMPWGRPRRCFGSEAQAGGVLCTPVNHCREKADPSKAGKTIYTSESRSDLCWKGPLQNSSSKPSVLLTYLALGHFGFPVAAT